MVVVTSMSFYFGTYVQKTTTNRSIPVLGTLNIKIITNTLDTHSDILKMNISLFYEHS